LALIGDNCPLGYDFLNRKEVVWMVDKTKEWAYGAIAEASFFGFLYYGQYLLKVDGNLWISSAVLWVLLNIAVALCPVMRKCHK